VASRPVFVPVLQGPPFVRDVMVEFEWHPGLSLAQRQRSVLSLHTAASAEHGLESILEISTRSMSPLGRSLSAFELRLTTPSGTSTCVEAAFQGSKVFVEGGPFTDLYGLDGGRAKKDPRLVTSGDLTGFRYCDVDWPLNPVHGFYEWLYITGLRESKVELDDLAAFGGFTDIEFNPLKSWNCQARAVARYVGMRSAGLLPWADVDAFLQAMVVLDPPPHQTQLF